MRSDQRGKVAKKKYSVTVPEKNFQVFVLYLSDNMSDLWPADVTLAD